MKNLVYSNKFRLPRRCGIAFLILAHLMLVTPLPEVEAMESANYKINQSTASSGGGKETSTGVDIPYSNLGDSGTENIESTNYKIQPGYINTIASNPPVLTNLIPDSTMRVVWDKGTSKDAVFDLDDYFSSPDGSSLTYTVEGGSSISVTIDPITHLVSFSQSSDYYGSENVRFIAIDETGIKTKSNFVVLVVKAPSNNPPVIHPINDITAAENDLITVTPNIFDLDGDTLTLKFTVPLDDSGTWQPTYDNAGIYTVRATVSDGTLTDSESFKITVRNVNRPPTIEPIQDIQVTEGDLVKLNARAYDPDGDSVAISYSAPFGQDGSWQTSYSDAGSYTVTVTASDGDLSASTSFSILVNDINAAPSVKIHTSSANVEPNEEFNIYVIAEDPDGDSLRLTLKKDGTIIYNGDMTGPTFTQNLSIGNTGNHTIQATAEEVGILIPNTASDSLIINVEEASSPEEYFPISGDFNGDGLTDLGYYNRALGIWKVALSNNGSFGVFEYWINGGFGQSNQYFYPLTSDFNADGRTDAGFIRVPTSDGAGSYIRITTSNAAGFDIQTGNWRDSGSGSLQSDWHFTTFTGDFNGDSLTDIGQIRVDDNQSLWVGLTEENLGTRAQADWITAGTHVSISDFSPLAGDFNGDSLTDLCLFKKNEGRWAVTLSHGDRFGDTSNWLTSFGTDKDPILGDFNHDGLTDIGYVYTENNQWSIKYAISDGTKFTEVQNPYQTSISEAIAGTLITGDFNGDGLFDVALFNKNTREWTVKLHASKYPDLLIEIDNGIGGKTKVSYKDSVIYDNTGVDETPDLPFPIRVVSQVTQEDGLGRSYKTDYFYENGFFEPGKREFRGFGYVTVTDAEGSVKETYFHQNNIFKGRPEREVIRDKYGKVYSETTYDWLAKTLGTSAEVPPDLGDGSDGVKVSSADETITGDKNYVSFTVNSGVTVTIDNTSTFYVQEDVVVNGTIAVKEGTFTINAKNISIGTNAKITTSTDIFDTNGTIILRAGSIDMGPGAVVEEDITDTVSGRSYSGNANVVDGDFSTMNSIGGQGGSITDTLTFDSTRIEKIKYKYAFSCYQYDGSASASNSVDLYYDGSWHTIASQSGSGWTSKDTTGSSSTGWSNVTKMRMTSSISGWDVGSAWAGHYEMRILGSPYMEGFSPSAVTGYLFPYLSAKTTKIYNPTTGENKSTKIEYIYDVNDDNPDNDYGNVTEIREYGFIGQLLKKLTITYTAPNLTDWLIGKPATSTIEGLSPQGTVPFVKVSEARYYYDSLALGAAPIKGQLTKEEKWLNLPTSQYIATNFTYDTSGNVETVTDARNSLTTTIYDATRTFPESVTNALGHLQQFTYDKATGKILTSTDPNNQVTTSEYDGFGRLKRVVGPGNISEVIYDYDLGVTPARVSTTTVIARSPQGDEAISAYSFIDGLGRQILSRIQAEYQGQAKHIVSGEVEYDSRGQVIKKYLPYYIDVTAPEDKYIAPSKSTPFMMYKYDAMGRLVETIRPDNKTSYILYNLNEVTAINENNQRTRQTKEEYGRIIEIKEEGGYITNYAYDVLGNLTDTYDSASPRNNTHIEYDSLGRKISMTDPDMGNWSYAYDDVGNLISQTDAKGQTINFEYDTINRLTRKWGLSPGGTVPIFSVDYVYDDTSEPNRIGRLSQVSDSSGTTAFFYDILGREITTTKTINGISYTIERTYDSLDRLITVTYPDTTIVRYAYNTQGGIASLRGGAAGADEAIYVSSVDYNANGQIEELHYGNGTSTTYDYDPYNFRLDHLSTVDSGLSTIQNLSYNFDPLGNVTSILDSVHTNTQHFQYDSLNRLIYANGASYGVKNYAIDSIGNLTQKGDLTLTYGERGHGPHAVTSVEGLSPQGTVPIEYDQNGNMISKGNTTFEYDIENRLKKVIAEKGGGNFDITISLNLGWNFISIPGFIPNTGNRIVDILSSIDTKYEQVSKYDPVSGEWKYFVNNTKFNQFDTFDPGEGYLIYINEACTLQLDGLFPIESQSRVLNVGWNLINAPTKTTIAVTEALQGITYDAVKVWNGATYDDATTLEAGKSYFVHVATSQTWNIPLQKLETTYLYDGDGGRVLRTSLRGTGGAEAISTLYIGSSFEAEGIPGQIATKQTKHIFMGSTRICSIETTDFDQPAPTEHTFYYHQDHLGSSNVITDETGIVVNILEYTPYGEVSRNTGNYSTDKRFTGKIWDESSALSYYGARYYDPELGRFITADPTIQRPYDPQDFNRYAYARNNPVKYIDPTGLSWWSALWNWIAGFVGAVVTAIVAAIATPVALPFALAMGGAAAGAILGGVNGGLGGALKGAAFGFVAGAYIGMGGPVAATLAAAGGAAYAAATGGLEGLGDFAAGMAGAVSGYYAGQAITSGSTRLNTTPTQTNTKSQSEVVIENKENSSDYVGAQDTARKKGGLITQYKEQIRLAEQVNNPRFRVQGKIYSALGVSLGKYTITDRITGETLTKWYIGVSLGEVGGIQIIDTRINAPSLDFFKKVDFNYLELNATVINYKMGASWPGGNEVPESIAPFDIGNDRSRAYGLEGSIGMSAAFPAPFQD